MKTIKMSLTSRWVKFWSIICGKEPDYELPSNTCNFKRDLILFTFLSVVFFPLILLWQIALLFIKKDHSPGKMMIVIISVVQGVVYGLTAATYKAGMSLILQFLLMSGVMILSLSVIIAIIYVAIKIGEWSDKRAEARKERDRDKVKKQSFLKVLYLSWKEKLCSKIEYVAE